MAFAGRDCREGEEVKMRLSKMWLAPVFALTIVAVAGAASAERAPRGVACQSGKYVGKAAGKRISFDVDCSRRKVSNIALAVQAKCLPDNHKESATATYAGSIPIKKKNVPDPDHPGKKETYYYLAYNETATEFTVRGTKGGEKPTSVDVFLRGTTPPNGKTKGTADISYGYGTDEADPEAGYKYHCGGGPVPFTAKRR